MTLEERIEAATDAYLGALGLKGRAGSGLKADAKAIVRAFAPELFTNPPTMWLAPMEVTKEMADAGGNTLEDCKDSGWDSGPDGEGYNTYEYIIQGAQTKIFDAMRDAYLQQESGE